MPGNRKYTQADLKRFINHLALSVDGEGKPCMSLVAKQTGVPRTSLQHIWARYQHLIDHTWIENERRQRWATFKREVSVRGQRTIGEMGAYLDELVTQRGDCRDVRHLAEAYRAMANVTALMAGDVTSRTQANIDKREQRTYEVIQVPAKLRTPVEQTPVLPEANEPEVGSQRPGATSTDRPDSSTPTLTR